jgi:hypothetical protein
MHSSQHLSTTLPEEGEAQGSTYTSVLDEALMDAILFLLLVIGGDAIAWALWLLWVHYHPFVPIPRELW